MWIGTVGGRRDGDLRGCAREAVRGGCALWGKASPCGGGAPSIAIRDAMPLPFAAVRTSPLTCSRSRVPQENAISAEIVSDGLIKEDLMEELALTELECDAVLLGCV